MKNLAKTLISIGMAGMAFPNAAKAQTIIPDLGLGSNIEVVDAGLEHLDDAMDLAQPSREFTEGDSGLSDVLHPDDSQFNPDFSPAGAPTVPVHCEVEGGPACQQCYSDAYTKVNFVRFYLERLRAIYGATKNYQKNAIAFGDSMAGLHGGFGIAWPPERKGIQDEFKKLGVTYDKKYADYMRELHKGLQAVAACEKQYFGEDDWYSRFGFMYYTFMQDRYRRPT